MIEPEERPLGFKPDVPSYRELRSQERRQEILEAAARLFRERGYNAVTIEEIASSLRMTKGSLYHYIHGKEDLLYECNRAAITPLMAEAQAIVDSGEPPDEKLRRLIRLHVSRLIDDPYMASLILHHIDSIPKPIRTIMVELRNAYDTLVKRIISEGIAAKVFVDTSPTLVTYFLLGACNDLPTWYRPEGKKTREEIIDFFVEIALRAVRVTGPA